MSVRAIVRDGRIRVDEATELPEGTVLDLVVDDEGDDLSDSEHDAIQRAIAASLEDAGRGRTAPASAILDRLSRG